MNPPGWEMSSMLLGRTEGNHGVAKSQTRLSDWSTMIGSKALQERFTVALASVIFFHLKKNINDPVLRIKKNFINS